MTDAPTIDDAELHAYVDGQLPAERQAAVEAYLAQNPEAAERVREYRRQNELLRAAFVLDEEPERPRRWAISRAGRWRRASAMAASLALAAALGWFVRGEVQPAPEWVQSLPSRAAIAHVVYAPDVLHPVEVGADQEAHLVQWLSKRLGVSVRAPQLAEAGFRLVGGRLLPGADRPAAQFMYEDAEGRRLTLYVAVDGASGRETAFRFAREGEVSVFYWIDGPVGYALSGEVEREPLLRVAQVVYRNLNR